MLGYVFKRNERTTLLPTKYYLFNTETNKISNKVRSTKSVCYEFEHFPFSIYIFTRKLTFAFQSLPEQTIQERSTVVAERR